MCARPGLWGGVSGAHQADTGVATAELASLRSRLMLECVFGSVVLTGVRAVDAPVTSSISPDLKTVSLI